MGEENRGIDYSGIINLIKGDLRNNLKYYV